MVNRDFGYVLFDGVIGMVFDRVFCFGGGGVV